MVQEKADGYQGIWYPSERTGDEYALKYSGGLGTCSAKHIPLAYYAPAADKTFFCYGGTIPCGSSLVEMVSWYDHSTGLVSRPLIPMDKCTEDAHDNPVLTLDPSGRVWVFASAHGMARPAYVFRSVEPQKWTSSS